MAPIAAIFANSRRRIDHTPVVKLPKEKQAMGQCDWNNAGLWQPFATRFLGICTFEGHGRPPNDQG
jgi:hypothetical protein